MKRRIIALAGLISTFSVSAALAAFSDDFSNEASSNLAWPEKSEGVTMQFKDQACSIVNGSEEYLGMVRHSFSEAERSSTFTLSGKITLDDPATMGAGFAICLEAGGKMGGYYIAIRENRQISITRMSSQGSGTMLHSVAGTYLTMGTNVLKVSKKDDRFNVFCNGHFTATFTDDGYSKGDIGLLVAPKTTAVFDDIVLSDTFEEGAPPSCFSDSFEDEDLLGWDRFGDQSAPVRIDKNSLRITTGSGQDVYQFVNIGLDRFVMRVVVSHRGGSTVNLYGLFLCGTAAEFVPLTGFGIDGSGRYAVFSPGESYTQEAGAGIKGDPFVSSTGDTTYYLDTLEVVRKEGASEYIFVANGDTLTRLAEIDFTVTGAGLFCLDSMDIAFDDFLISEGGGNCTVAVSPQNRRSYTFSENVDMRLFDCSGRLISGNGKIRAGRFVPGLYLQRRPGNCTRIRVK